MISTLSALTVIKQRLFFYSGRKAATAKKPIEFIDRPDGCPQRMYCTFVAVVLNRRRSS
ncbi:hypothetical protein [Caballeronia sp. GACF4]|uniref:hypothetical protein n=1 Tax=Caballeronia sp. GACF4 TaxID=2921763 RepID=UPI0020296D04|nr:hypothetical protein [Caballeronia sp. GACF4]